MKLSLVTPTLGRTRELETLLEGFAAQTFRDFEVILVDQNDDDRLAPIVARHAETFTIRHVRSSVKNASHARNLGLNLAQGTITGFPDDDCEYLPDTMRRVVDYFDRDPRLALLCGVNRSDTGELLNGRWTPRSCAIDERNVWTTLQGYNMWMLTAAAIDAGGWDSAIGPGTPWGSSEEPDLGVRMLRRGYRGFYDVNLVVRHPDKRLSEGATARAFDYGAGMGRVLRRHSIAPSIALPFFVRPIGGLLLSLLRGRIENARYYWRTFRGRLFGYMAPPAREGSHA